MMTVSFVVPASEWATILEEAIRQDTATSRENGLAIEHKYSLYTIESRDALPSDLIHSTVIVSRGILVEEIRNVLSSIPVIEIPIGNELAAVASRALRKHGNLPIAVIGSASVCYHGHGLTEIIPDCTVRCYRQDSRVTGRLNHLIDEALADGAKIIIGGPNTCKMASARSDCHVYPIPLSRVSAWFALMRAKAEATRRCREREKSAQLQALLSSSEDGIITTDKRGQITAFNQGAESLLGVPAMQALNAPIRSLLPDDMFYDMKPGLASKSGIIDRDGKKIAVKKTGILMGQQVMGHVVTLRSHARVE